jgi:signal transduction histidine kinase
VRLAVQGHSLRLEVNDDGQGFDPSSPRDGEGRANIARRIRDVGGEAGWDTAPGAGTRFFADIPMNGRKSHLN